MLYVDPAGRGARTVGTQTSRRRGSGGRIHRSRTRPDRGTRQINSVTADTVSRRSRDGSARIQRRTARTTIHSAVRTNTDGPGGIQRHATRAPTHYAARNDTDSATCPPGRHRYTVAAHRINRNGSACSGRLARRHRHRTRRGGTQHERARLTDKDPGVSAGSGGVQPHNGGVQWRAIRPDRTTRRAQVIRRDDLLTRTRRDRA